MPVTLAARSTAIGTLELYCVAKEGGNRWRLEFNVRDLVKEAAPKDDVEDDRPASTDVWPETQVQEAGRLHPRRLRRAASRPDAAGADQGAGSGPGGDAARVADRPVPPAVGLPRRGGRAAPAVAGAPDALVQPGRLLPAAGLRRPARPLPRRAAVEDAGRPAAAAGRPARRGRSRAGRTTGSCGGASPAG